MPSRLAALAALLVACGGASHDPQGVEGKEPPPQGLREPIRMGPLANAGPDQRALPGMEVRLDGRGTLRPEGARPYRLRWVQESGPGALLSDPSSPVASFVAPPILPGSADRLVFRLVADDGILSSRDRVVVQLVEDPFELVSAPVAIAGEDLEAEYGDLVSLPPPNFLDPSCLDEDESETCMEAPLPFCWTQVFGAPVELQGACGGDPATFTAPAHDELLIFRLDAHGKGPNPAVSTCGPEGERPDSTPPCSAPDYLRVVVREQPRRGDTVPTTFWYHIRNEEKKRVDHVIVEGRATEIPSQLEITAGARDTGEKWRLHSFFRPILGWVDDSLTENRLQLSPPPWPSAVAVAFETLYSFHQNEGGQTRWEWFHGPPPVALIAWRPPIDRAPLVADPGPLPCSETMADGGCGPFVPGEMVELRGGPMDHPSPGTLQACWQQTFGPKVALDPADPGNGCLPGQGTRRFEAPAPLDGKPLQLAFQFTVKDAGPFSSRPTTLLLQVRPESLLPPTVLLQAPPSLLPGESGTLDASNSRDPEGGPLRFRWKQVSGQPVGMKGCGDPVILASTACILITTSLEAEGSIEVEVEALSATSSLLTRRRIEIPIAPPDDPP